MYPLRIEKLYMLAWPRIELFLTHLSNDLGWFRVIDCFQILLHRTIVILLLVQKVSILAKDDILLAGIHSSLLCQIDGVHEKVSLVENLQSLR